MINKKVNVHALQVSRCSAARRAQSQLSQQVGHLTSAAPPRAARAPLPSAVNVPPRPHRAAPAFPLRLCNARSVGHQRHAQT